jgi:hypothetical protein
VGVQDSGAGAGRQGAGTAADRRRRRATSDQRVAVGSDGGNDPERGRVAAGCSRRRWLSTRWPRCPGWRGVRRPGTPNPPSPTWLTTAPWKVDRR